MQRLVVTTPTSTFRLQEGYQLVISSVYVSPKSRTLIGIVIPDSSKRNLLFIVGTTIIYHSISLTSKAVHGQTSYLHYVKESWS
jgi:hypothetical protein